MYKQVVMLSTFLACLTQTILKYILKYCTENWDV